MRWAGHVARIEEGRSAFKILTGTSAEKRPLGSPRRIWDDNIRINLLEISINTRDWVDLAQDRDYSRAFVNAAMDLRVPQAMELVKIPTGKRPLGALAVEERITLSVKVTNMIWLRIWISPEFS